MDIIQLADLYHANEKVDGVGDTFRRRARILQSIWREERAYACGTHRGRPLGSRLPTEWARETLANFLTPAIRQLVREEVLESPQAGRLIKPDRLFGDLLSSQPLCFNLFGELQRDLAACTAVMSEMTRGRVQRVTRLAFEHSPGRGDASYTGDRSAFDVYFEYEGDGGVHGFAGIEVKYHEDLKGVAADHRSRYDEIADAMGCFDRETRNRLLRQPLQQIWRDHLLAGSILNRRDFDDGFFVFLHPASNRQCGEAAAGYASCLTSDDTFAAWTLEQLVATIRGHVSAPWVDAVWDRYLDFGKIDRALATPGGGPPSTSSTQLGAMMKGNGMPTISVNEFLRDSTGRCFVDVVNADPGLFERIVDFCGDQRRQRQMVEAVLNEARPALAGIVVELERQPWFEAHMASNAADDTKRLRRAIGVLVRTIVERHGLRKKGRKGSLPESRWFGSAERYEAHESSR